MRRLPLLAFACLLAGLTAQERRPTRGRVLDAEGKAVVGAKVLATTPLATHLTLGAPDLVQVDTDERGAFAVDLLPGHGYAIGAVGPSPGEGLAPTSPLVGGIAAGEFVTLRLGRAVAARTLHVDGVAAWGDERPRRVRMRLQRAPGVVAEIDLGDDGQARMPHLPTGAWMVELLLADGSTLWSKRVDAGADAAPTTALSLPPPRTLVCRAIDEQGRPVAGAAVQQRTAWGWLDELGVFGQLIVEAWRPLGTTDAAGMVTARVAISGNDDWIHPFVAHKPGLARAVAALIGGNEVVDARARKDADARELHFELGPTRALRARILERQQVPFAGRSLVVEATRRLPLANGGATDVALLLPVQTDAEGRLHVGDLPPDTPFTRVLVPPSLRRADGARLPTTLLEVLGVDITGAQDVVLAELHSVDVQVTRADGGPAEGVTAVLLPLARRRWFVEPWDGRHRLDRAGRARLCVPPGDVVLFCTDGREFAQARIDERLGRVDLRMEPLASTRVTVRTATGAPAVGASFEMASYSPAVQEERPERQARAAAAVTLMPQMLRDLRTDEHGVALVRSIPDSGVNAGLVARSGVVTSAEVSFAPGELEIVLPAAAK